MMSSRGRRSRSVDSACPTRRGLDAYWSSQKRRNLLVRSGASIGERPELIRFEPILTREIQYMRSIEN